MWDKQRTISYLYLTHSEIISNLHVTQSWSNIRNTILDTIIISLDKIRKSVVERTSTTYSSCSTYNDRCAASTCIFLENNVMAERFI